MPTKPTEHALGTTYMLTITNPANIFVICINFLRFGLTQTNSDYIHDIILVFGITLGSAIWWMLRSGGVTFILHHRLSPTVMKNINRISGIIILIFGIYALSNEIIM